MGLALLVEDLTPHRECILSDAGGTLSRAGPVVIIGPPLQAASEVGIMKKLKVRCAIPPRKHWLLTGFDRVRLVQDELTDRVCPWLHRGILDDTDASRGAGLRTDGAAVMVPKSRGDSDLIITGQRLS